jgi:hypothetical protein
MTHHTSGPWAISPDLKTIYSIDGLGYRADTVARVTIPSQTDAKRARADMRLIAAAPELLAACEALLAVAGDDWSDKYEAAKALALAAINKAKGA